MIFSFMLLMATNELRDTMPGQAGPQKHNATSLSSLTAVPQEKIGRLIKKHGRLYLKFGNVWYHPVRDIHRLKRDQRISELPDPDDGTRRLLYLEENTTHDVLLAEYLTAFHSLSVHGIVVAFAERVK
jgi:hypothetical protein